ncbi:MAG TPA: lysozyme [Bacteroides mediterraneensis]|uniref:glycoside hydrolase family protein n=1 Tax=Bacteroides mediterraneensis TaxID=1841856 RepID=UPI0026ED9468|nr:lysozyme [Bacteroides mediterraneensis]HJH65380.1 lysozyme [Bacteroides mediterraneensis]
MKRLFAVAVLAVAFSASLPAQGTDETAASFHDEPKAELAVELIKKYEGLHDRSDYPYYGYGHCKLPGEELSYDMTEAEAEELLRKDLAERYKLFRKYKKDALLLTVLSYNVGHGTLLGYGKRPKSRLVKKLEAGDRNIYMEYISYCHYKGRKIRSIERRRKMEFLLLYEK